MKVKTYAVSILIALLAGGFAALFTADNMMIYGDIITPALSPPAIVFPIVWTILYTLMGIGAARVCIEGNGVGSQTAEAIRVYAVQLAVNVLWSIVFFNMRAFLASLTLLVILWVLIVVMLIRFWRVDKLAAIINIPYLLWVTFAGYLNLMIYILNM